MPLLGEHSKNPGGNPQNLTQMQLLYADAQRGDRTAIQALQTIAAGGTTGKIGGFFGDQSVNWGSTDDAGSQGGRAAERSYAQALLSGNQQQAQQIAQNAGATHQDWTGGTLANLAPIAAAFIPGVGPLAAAGLGAALGGLESATGITNDSFWGGAARGGAEAGAAGAAKSLLGGSGAAGGGLPGTDIPGAPGSGMDAYGDPIVGGAPGAAGHAAGGGGGGLGSLFSGGKINLPGGLGQIGLGDIAKLGLAGADTYAGAQQYGKARALQDQLLAETQAQQKDRDAIRARLMGSSTLGTIPQRPDLGSLFAGSQNPFARGRQGGVSAAPPSGQPNPRPQGLGAVGGGPVTPGWVGSSSAMPYSGPTIPALGPAAPGPGGATGGMIQGVVGPGAPQLGGLQRAGGMTPGGTGSAQPSVQRFTGPMVNLQGAPAPQLGPLQGAGSPLARRKALAGYV